MPNAEAKIKIVALSIIFILGFQKINSQNSNDSIRLKVREVGIATSGFNSFSLQYRWGTSTLLKRISGGIGSGSQGQDISGTYSSTSTFSNPSAPTQTAGQTISQNNQNPLNASVNFGFSILKLKPIHGNLGFLYGQSFTINYFINLTQNKETTISNNSPYYPTTVTNITKTNSQSLTPVFGLIFGLSYKIIPNFYVYAELNPSVYYSFGISNSSSIYTESNLGYSTTTRTSSNPGYIYRYGITGLSNSGALLTFVYRWSK